VSWCNSVGHRGKFGHEFMEFEFRADGKLRYANNSNYKKDSMIRKEGAWPPLSCAWLSAALDTVANANALSGWWWPQSPCLRP
jgi:hypothetical protein